jgi:acetoacetate decarboxylase
MPTFGLLDTASAVARTPHVQSFDTEAWTLPGAEILQLAWEVPPASDALLPKAMHPAIPRYVTFLVARYPESPVGPFLLAQLRLMGRAGAHPRGFVLGAVASTPAAAAALRDRWAFPAKAGAVALRRYHDRIDATVNAGGAPILEAGLINPEVISGGDVQFIHSITFGQAMEDGRPVPYLVQVDPHYTFHRAERGRPQLSRFDAEAWNAGSLRLTSPIAASLSAVDTDLPQIRFVMHPETPVVRGTKRIR